MEHSHFLNFHQLKDIPSCFQRIYTTKMNQEQPRRTHQEHEKEEQNEPIKYARRRLQSRWGAGFQAYCTTRRCNDAES